MDKFNGTNSHNLSGPFSSDLLTELIKTSHSAVGPAAPLIYALVNGNQTVPHQSLMPQQPPPTPAADHSAAGINWV